MSKGKIFPEEFSPNKVPSARFGGGKDIILRAWHWNIAKTSQKGTDQGSGVTWYQKVKQQVTQMKNAGFTVIYLPPPWRDDSSWKHGGGEGYFWHDAFNVDTYYGSSEDLKALTKSIDASSMKVIFDAVPNHRNHYKMFEDIEKKGSIKNTDPKIWEYPGPCWRDGGEDDGGYFGSGDCDLNISNPVVFNYIKEALAFLKNEFFAAGFRWDFVWGWDAKWTKKWMDEVYGKEQGISIGEYWPNSPNLKNDPFQNRWDHLDPSQPGSCENRIIGWAIDAESAIKDYVLKGYFNSGKVENFKNGLNCHQDRCIREKAITFVETHDTGASPWCETSGHGQIKWPTPKHLISSAYAFIFMMPGIPCVYWPDYFDFGYGFEIAKLMHIRTLAKISSGSKWIDLTERYSGFAAIVLDENDNEAVAISINSDYKGPGEKWVKAAENHNKYIIWMKIDEKTLWKNVFIAGTCNFKGKTVMLSSKEDEWEAVVYFDENPQPHFRIIGENEEMFSETLIYIEKNIETNHIYKVVFNSTKKSIAIFDLGEHEKYIKLSVQKDVGFNNAIYFTGNIPALTNMGSGVQATWTENNVWELKIKNPGCKFEWKVLEGAVGKEGLVQEIGENGDSSVLTINQEIFFSDEFI